MLLGKLTADLQENPVMQSTPGTTTTLTTTKTNTIQPTDDELKCTNPSYPHLSKNTAFGICYSEAAWAKIDETTNETTDCMFGGEPAACNLSQAISGVKQKSKCSNAPACEAVHSPELGTMGGTVDLYTSGKPATFSEYMDRIKEDESRLNSIIKKMEGIVTGHNFKGLESEYMKDSKKALHEIADSRSELEKWKKKVAEMRAELARSGADLENSKLESKSHYYFYITWFAMAIIMCGVAFKFLNQPIFNVIAGLIAAMAIAPYVYGLIMTFVDDVEDYAENININKILGP